MKCPCCGSADCARMHAWRYRKRIYDLATGEIFEDLPIRRIRFCSGTTASIMPADLWRGRATVDSVLQTVVHVLRQGAGPALEWAAEAGTGEEPVSERTVRRWTGFVSSRLIGSAFSWIGPRLDWAWSDARATTRSAFDPPAPWHMVARSTPGTTPGRTLMKEDEGGHDDPRPDPPPKTHAPRLGRVPLRPDQRSRPASDR